MAEDKKASDPRMVQYSSNSKTQRPSAENERPLPAQVVPTGQAVARKKSIRKKFREQFAGDDAKTVGVYLLVDVVVPALKNLLYDLGNEGLKRTLFGGSARPGAVGTIIGSTLASTSRTAYSSFSKAAPNPATQIGPSTEMTPQQRAMHDFSGIILQSREQAYQIIDVLSGLIDDYGAATVNDFYACIGQTPEFTAVKYGWKSLGSAEVRHIREGYLLEMPRPVVLE